MCPSAVDSPIFPSQEHSPPSFSMAPAAEEAQVVGPVGSEAVLPNDRPANVLDLLEQHFPHLASAAGQLLFEPHCAKEDIFGVSQYATVVNTACQTAAVRIPGGGAAGAASAHSTSVVWVAASFLYCQKLIRVGASVDAGLANSCPILLDAAMLSKYCSSKDQHPVRACTRSLSIAHVQLVCEANMKLLMPAQLYTAYTDIICLLANEILTTSLNAVAVQAMLTIAGVANTAFIKFWDTLNEVDLKRPSDGPQFPKEDVSHDLLHSLTKPLYGHQPLLVSTMTMCGNVSNPTTGDVDWPATMRKYEANLIWLFDWNVEGRDDRLPVHLAELIFLDSNSNEEAGKDTVEAIVTRERNRIGCLFIRWDNATENALIRGKERKLPRHTGWLCQQPDIVREILVATTLNCQYGLWPSGDWNNVQDLWWDVAACIGAMVRGCTLDHDTEAEIGEHNEMNLVCKLCATKISARAMALEKDLPLRTVRAQRLAWGPLPYFFYSRRHSGLARRVYSAKFFSRPGIPWGAVTCTAFDHPVTTPTNLSMEAMIVYLLNLTGFAMDSAGSQRIAAVMPEIVNPTAFGVCQACEFDGMGQDMMLYGHGIMMIAAALAEPARRRFCWEMDAYGGRAFPTLYSRMLAGCACTNYWIEEMKLLGYDWGLSGCGSDCCSDGSDVLAALPLPKSVQESDSDWSKNSRVKANLQVLLEACKSQFEALDSVRVQMEAELLEEGWCIVSRIHEVQAMLNTETAG